MDTSARAADSVDARAAALVGDAVPAAALAPAPGRGGLSPREHEVNRWAVTGRTNPEIAAQPGLTCNTVTGCLKSAMHKLGVRHRTEPALAVRASGPVG